MSGTWLRSLQTSGAACAVATAVVLAAANNGCTAHVALDRGAEHGPMRAVLTTTFRLAGITGVATGGGAAWATTGNAVLRIDPRTDRVSQFLSDPGASLTSVAFGAGSLWVKDIAGILRVDPGTGKVTARIAARGSALSFGEGALWTLTYDFTRSSLLAAQLVRIDPATNAVRTFPLQAAKTWGLAAGEGAVWVSTTCMASACLLRVDPATGRVTRVAGPHLFGQITVGDGAAWVSDGARVTRIDPSTGRPTAIVPLLSLAPTSDTSPILNGSGLLAAAPGVVWVTRAANARHASLLRLDPRTGRLTGAGLAVGRLPQAVASSGSTAWVMTGTGLARADLVTCPHGRCARAAPPAALPAALAPVWLQSLQMVSASDGWALVWTSNPASPVPAGTMLVHTTDGGRTWTTVTPAQASPLQASDRNSMILQARSASRAWLAVTFDMSQADYGIHPARTVTFGTADGGRTWTRSAPIHAPGYASSLAFTDATHGWLLQSLGAAMQQNPVQVYRTVDGGRRWSLIAETLQHPGAGTSTSGLPVSCDKTGIAFATPADGWLTSACFSLAGAVLATHDGGALWAPQPLPLPAGTCGSSSCLIYPPQFFGPTGFLTIPHARAPYLLVSHDTGATWQAEPLPRAVGPLASVHFFDARHGLLISAPVEQDSPGRVFYVTSDGGRTWTPLRQGMRFQPGTTVDFASPEAGFAWNSNASGAPLIYATTNGGRNWTGYFPRLVTARPAGPGTPAPFQPAAVSFVSPAQGWVLGQDGCQDCAALRATKDGGAHWSALPAPPAPLGPYSNSPNAVTNISFANHANGFLYGPGLLATHDGGRSWTREPLPPVKALSIGAGYAYGLTRRGGALSLWRTAVGSDNWALLRLPAGATRPVAWRNETQLYAEGSTLVLLRPGFTGPTAGPGQAGQLWVSVDDGTGWKALRVPCVAPSGGGAAILSIALGHPAAWLVDCFNNEQSSQEQNTQHHLYGTTDDGLSWVHLPDPTAHNAPVLLADNGSGHAFLATEGGAGDTLVGTLDYGLHWHPVVRDGGSFFGWAGLSFVTAKTGFVVGPTHYAPEHLYRTDDGGRTWRALRF